MQNHYNLIYREEDLEMIPLGIDLSSGLIPQSTGSGLSRRETAISRAHQILAQS